MGIPPDKKDHPRKTKRKWLKEKLIERQGPYCYYCGVELVFYGNRSNPNHATFDHKVPKSRGGKTNLNNLVLACKLCNHGKADKRITPELFIYLQELRADYKRKVTKESLKKRTGRAINIVKKKKD